jgi:hypothetical protein
VRPVECDTALPLVVITKNLTDRRGDLCAAFNRAVRRLSIASSLAGGFELRVSLRTLTLTPRVSCTLAIELASNGRPIESWNGGANLTPGGAAARDCIDAVLEDLMTKLINRHGGTRSPSGGAIPPTPSPSGGPHTP